jgi:hypothetical protein
VFEVFGIGALALAVLAMLGVLWAVASLVCWVLFLPFKLLGLIFRGFAFLLALPFLLIAALIGVAIFGVGVLLFLFPAVPIILIALGIWWVMRHRDKRAPVTP